MQYCFNHEVDHGPLIGGRDEDTGLFWERRLSYVSKPHEILGGFVGLSGAFYAGDDVVGGDG
jgi:hypothetical protein